MLRPTGCLGGKVDEMYFLWHEQISEEDRRAQVKGQIPFFRTIISLPVTSRTRSDLYSPDSKWSVTIPPWSWTECSGSWLTVNGSWIALVNFPLMFYSPLFVADWCASGCPLPAQAKNKSTRWEAASIRWDAASICWDACTICRDACCSKYDKCPNISKFCCAATSRILPRLVDGMDIWFSWKWSGVDLLMEADIFLTDFRLPSTGEKV